MLFVADGGRTPAQTYVFGAINDRSLAALRLVLAASALIIVYLDPSETDLYVPLTSAALVAYTAYSLALYVIARRLENFSWVLLQCVTWTDLLWYTLLIALSGGTNSIFFFFYFFAIIVASSRGGRKMGMAVTVASALLFAAVGFFSAGEDQERLNRLLLRPTYLLVLGYILAYWGGAEIALKRRLALLKEISSLSNPRFGVNRTIGQVLQGLVKFYAADSCFFLLSDSNTGLHLYRATRWDPEGGSVPVQLREDVEIPPFKLSESYATVYSERSRFGTSRRSYKGYEPQTDKTTHKTISLPEDSAVAAAQFLNARSFVAAPLRCRERIRGRICVSTARPNGFDVEDAAFLLQVGEQVLPMIENIRLVDRLASDAAEQERRKIARGIHDRVIQPYLGLKMGLTAVHRLLESQPAEKRNGGTRVANGKPLAMLSELMTMTSDGVEELRQYVYGLKNGPTGETSLIDSLRRFALKFESATGVHVGVEDGLGRLILNDRLAGELFQMTAEALSNIHRHTGAQNARVALLVVQNNLVLLVENEVDEDTEVREFRPLSISERADALGGRIEVSRQADRTIVKVEVPL